MCLFLLLFLPISYSLLFTLQNENLKFYSNHPIRDFLLGISLGCLYSFIELSFVFPLIQTPHFVLAAIWPSFFGDFVVPVTVCLGILLLTSRMEYRRRFEKMFVFMLGFYSMYLVYSSLLRYEKTDFFLLFLKPILILCQIYISSQMLLLIFDAIAQKEKGTKIALLFGILFAAGLIPPLCRSLYVIGIPIVVVLLLVAAYCVFTVFFFKYVTKINLMKKTESTVDQFSLNI